MTPESRGPSGSTRKGGPDLSYLERFLGDLMVEGELGRTSNAVIYQIRAGSRADRPLALKMALRPMDPEGMARFQHEVRLLSEVQHPNVVQVYDFGVLPGNYPFLAMEFLETQDLFQWVLDHDWNDFYHLALQAVAGLAHIHRHGIVHLDIKPANLGLMVDEDEMSLKILDFGLAQNLMGPLDRKIRGTLAYAAPEVLSQDRWDHRADLYSLGMTLFHLATGVLPSAGSDGDAIKHHLQGETPDPLAYRSDMPVNLAAILRRLLQRDPERRFNSTGRLLGELSAAAGRDVDTGVLALGEGTVLASRMVGREAELERMGRILSKVSGGRGQVVVVSGADGVGKSRLLREFRLTVGLLGGRVALARAVAGRPEPLRPFRAVLRQVGADFEFKAESDDEKEGRYEVIRQVGRSLRAAAQSHGPVVLLLDDLHAVPESLEVFMALRKELVDARVMLVAACRSGTVIPEVDDGLDDPITVELSPLSHEETARLVDSSLGTVDLPVELYRWIYSTSRGFPGRAQQLIRHLVEERVLEFQRGDWQATTGILNRLDDRLGSVEALDRERLAALSAEDRQILEVVALIDDAFHWGMVAEVLGIDDQQAYERLSTLRNRGLVEIVEESSEEFFHLVDRPLARLAAASMSIQGAREIHLKIARRLEGFFAEGRDEVVLEVGEHYFKSGERKKSLPFLEIAASEARREHSFSSAADLYGRVVEIGLELGAADQVEEARLRQAECLESAGALRRALRLYHACLEARPVTRRRDEDRQWDAELCLRLARVHGRLGEAAAELASAERGLSIVQGLGLTELEVDLSLGRASGSLASGDEETAFGVARAALKKAIQHELHLGRAGLLAVLGRIFAKRRDFDRARRILFRGLMAADAAGSSAMRFELRRDLGLVLSDSGNYQKARELFEANRDQANRTEDSWGQAISLHHLGILLCRQGRWKEARGPLRRGFELLSRLDHRGTEEVEAQLHLGEIEEMLGDWSRAQVFYERAMKLVDRGASNEVMVAVRAAMASLARKQGDWVRSEKLAQQALSEAQRRADEGLLAFAHHQLALVEKDRERWGPAEAHLTRALELATRIPTYTQPGWIENSFADLAMRRGRPERARAHIEAARDWAEKADDQFEMAKALSAEARLAIHEKRYNEVDELFRQTVALFERLEMPFEYALTLQEWGFRTSNPSIAEERLDRALVAFSRLGATTEMERTRGAIEGFRERGLVASDPASQPGLWETARVINTSLDLAEVLARTMDLVLERLRAERGMIVLHHELTGELEVAASQNLGESEQDKEKLDLSETVVRRVIEKNEPVLSIDALADNRFAESESIVASSIRSILCVPLTIRDRRAGAIYLDHTDSQHLFADRDLQFLVAFADQAAVAIENARLYGELDEARRRLKAENESLRREVFSSRHLGSMIGKGRAMVELKETLERVSHSNSTVLIRGESGTGKGLVARTLHAVSHRRKGPFVHFNCAALPETLIESELFGHEKGAFTGAVGSKPGRFEMANGGTIFLDEIGKISPSVQAKLLRVVEDKRFERLGGTRTLSSDVRIVAATNLNLEEAIRDNTFREDLYYRLNIIPIILPPLRERKEDIAYLVEHFLKRISRDLGQETRTITPEVLEIFESCRWPGNIRELEATIHRGIVLSKRENLTPADFAWLAPAGVTTPPGDLTAVTVNPARLGDGGYQELLDSYDRQLIAEGLEHCEGRIREASRLLGLARNTLKAKMKKFSLY